MDGSLHKAMLVCKDVSLTMRSFSVVAGSICCMSTISVRTLPSVSPRVAVPFDMLTRLYVLQEGKVLSVSKTVTL